MHNFVIQEAESPLFHEKYNEFEATCVYYDFVSTPVNVNPMSKAAHAEVLVFVNSIYFIHCISMITYNIISI